MMVTDQIAEEQPSPPRSPQAQPGFADVTDLEQQARAWIRQRPVAAVLAAVAAGYLAARLLARATR